MNTTFTPSELGYLEGALPRIDSYLSVHIPHILGSLRLAAVPTDTGRSIAAFEFDPLSLTYSPNLDWTDLTIGVGTSHGDTSKGLLRLRGWDLDNNLILVGEVGEHEIDFDPTPANNYFTIFEQQLIWARLPSSSGLDYDLANSGDDHYNYPPIARIGPHAIGWKSQPIKFVGEFSDDMGQEGGITSWLWEFPDGTTSNAQGTVASPVTWTPASAYPNGRMFRLTVTIGATGKAHTRWGVVWVYDADNPPMSASIPSIPMGGGEIVVTVPDESAKRLTEASYPAGAACAIWTETTWPNGTTGAIGGYPYREDVLFCGWLTGQLTINMSRDVPTLSLRIGTHDVVMSRIQSAGFTKYFESVAKPRPDWLVAVGLNQNICLRLLARWHSTLDNVADIWTESTYGESVQVGVADIPTGTLLEQLNAIGQLTPVTKVAYDSVGGVYVDLIPNHLEIADRANIPEIMVVTDAHRPEMMSVERQTPQVAQVKLTARAITQLSPLRIKPFAAVSPTYPAGVYGGKLDLTQGYWAPSQEKITAWTGAIRGARNVRYPSVSITLPGPYRISPSPARRVSLSFDPDQSGQALAWAGKTFWIVDSRLEWIEGQNLYLTRLTLTEDSAALAGTVVPLPSLRPPEPGPPDPPGDPLPPKPDGGETNSWKGELAIVTKDKGAFVTLDFSGPDGPPPTWTVYDSSNTNLPADAVVLQAVEDPHTWGRFFCVLDEPSQPTIQRKAIWEFNASEGVWARLIDAHELGSIAVTYWNNKALQEGWAKPYRDPEDCYHQIKSIYVSPKNPGFLVASTWSNIGHANYDAFAFYSNSSGAFWEYQDRLAPTNESPPDGTDVFGFSPDFNSVISSDGQSVYHPVDGGGKPPLIYRAEPMGEFLWYDPPVSTPIINDRFLVQSPYNGRWALFSDDDVWTGPNPPTVATDWGLRVSEAVTNPAFHRYGISPFPARGETPAAFWTVSNEGLNGYFLENIPEPGVTYKAYTLNGLAGACAVIVLGVAPDKYYFFRMDSSPNSALATVWVTDEEVAHTDRDAGGNIIAFTCYNRSGNMPGDHAGVMAASINYNKPSVL